ncbi:MAG: hypothetical protein RLY61_69 [Candidatus Parcubacteria bacterium]|jgi:putative ABC transport system permease protein
MNEVLLTSLTSIRANKLRSFLTMLGVIIGVFAVVSMLSLGVGVQNYIANSFNSLGTNLLLVAPGRFNFRADPSNSFSRNKLEEKHVELIKRYASDVILAVSPSIRTGATIQYRDKEFFGTVIGINYDAINVTNYEVLQGRNISRTDEKAANKYALIGVETKKELFGADKALGKTIKINKESFTIIGEIAKKNQSYDQGVITPVTTVKEVFGIENYSNIAAKLKDPKDDTKARKIMEMALLRDLKADDFTVISQSELLASFQNILGLLTAGIGMIAGISLLVGGIGIMNIMLVSVTERTKEIGLRKAVGATPRVIVIQFLSEAIIISVAGGLIGILLAFLLTASIKSYIEASVPLYAIIIAFVFSVSVGAVFGTYPAIKAGKKDPIEALTFE